MMKQHPSRRSFLGTLAASAIAGSVWSYARAKGAEKPARPLRILILGGTGFIGPHQVRYALSRGHSVTLFNRGRTNPGLFPDLETLIGDRDDNLKALENRTWDAVIDNSASIPRWVSQSAEVLKNSVSTYLFVSSLSVLGDNSLIGADESAPVGKLDDPTVEEITGETFGPLKALCEREALKAFPKGAVVVRPGLIVGPGDRSDRFTYWPVRIDRGGEVLAPGDPTDPVQIIDARDLTGWMVRLIEAGASGVFNATGPASPLSMAEMLYGIRSVTPAEVTFSWIQAEFLAEQEVEPWSDMPVWVPPSGGMEGFSRVNCRKAIRSGLTFLPLAITARDTLDWFKTLPPERQANLRSGLKADKEARVLEAWRSRKKSKALNESSEEAYVLPQDLNSPGRLKV